MASEQFHYEARPSESTLARLSTSDSSGVLTVQTFAEAETITISLAGELDLATADLVRKALDEAHAQRPWRILIDLGKLTFIDSTGLALIISEAKRDRADDEPQLAILPGPPQVQRLFQIVGALERLPFARLA